MNRTVAIMIVILLAAALALFIIVSYWPGRGTSPVPITVESERGMQIARLLRQLAGATGDQLEKLLDKHLDAAARPESRLAFTQLASDLAQADRWDIEDITIWARVTVVQIHIEREGAAAWQSVILLIEGDRIRLKAVQQ